jgi:hypothetical protein
MGGIRHWLLDQKLKRDGASRLLEAVIRVTAVVDAIVFSRLTSIGYSSS